MEGFRTRGWGLILSGCGWTSKLARGATLAARWLYEPQSISNHWMGTGFPHNSGRFRAGRSPFSSPGCCSCRCMEQCLIWGWDHTLRGCAGTWTLARGANLAAPLLYQPQPTNNQWMKAGFHTVRGGIGPGDHRLRPRVVVVVYVRKILRPGDGGLSSSGAPGRQASLSAIRRWGRGFYTMGGGVDPGDRCSCPRLINRSSKYMEIPELGVGAYPPRLQQNPVALRLTYLCQHKPSRKEPAASGRDLMGQSAPRIDFQNCAPAVKLA